MALRFAVIGTGFWANYQIPAWLELEGVELVALCDKARSKAKKLATRFNVRAVYDDVEMLLQSERLDFVDIITGVDTHAPFTELAARRGIAVICQKPMAPTLALAQHMTDICSQFRVPLYIHENFRWQTPIRKLKSLLDAGSIGEMFKSRVTFCSAFPVFDNQPFLAELEEFILTDIGSHILDICRFLFGEVDSLMCHTRSINPKIRGEDVANVVLKMKNGIFCFAEMSYASILEQESFPQTFVLVEGEHGSIKLAKDFTLHISTRSGTKKIIAAPPMYPWADPDYALIHSSIVECNRNILEALQKKSPAETTGIDNLNTARLVHASYASARENKLIDMNTF
jgi:predicted dehydrogenase